jgi:hypothetical protein
MRVDTRATAVRPLALLLIGVFAGAATGRLAARENRRPEREPSVSRLWGAHGELWDPLGRLPDFSYAGYRAGERPLPDVPVVRDVKQAFGAVGDGVTDDTAAFVRAIDETSDGALLVPKGRYLIQRDLRIQKSRLVLRGEGPGKTVLHFTRSLEDLYGPNREWSWTGGMIDVGAWGKDWFLTTVATPARRGDRVLRVEVPSRVLPGMMVLLRLTDEASHTLWHHAHNDQAEYPAITTCMPMNTLDWLVQVEAVDVARKEVRLAQPLRTDVRLGWAPTIYRPPYIDEIGIEHLRIEFPAVPYAEHNREPGRNAIYFRNYVGNSWVRDVEIVNSDSAVHVTGSKWITVSGVTVDATRPPHRPEYAYGHHGLHAEASEDVLFEDFTFKVNFHHELGVEHQASGCVFSRGGGVGFSNDPAAGPDAESSSDTAFNLDHHRGWPFENLFTELGAPVSFDSSGNLCFGPHSGARGTFWNLPGPLVLPSDMDPARGGWWGRIQTNVIGDLDASTGERRTADGEWYEHLPRPYPANLYEAQRKRRLGR